MQTAAWLYRQANSLSAVYKLTTHPELVKIGYVRYFCKDRVRVVKRKCSVWFCGDVGNSSLYPSIPSAAAELRDGIPPGSARPIYTFQD